MMQVVFSKAVAVKAGGVALKVGKAVVIDGLKAQALKGASVAITTAFEQGTSSLKDITLDEVLAGKRLTEEDKVKLASKKKKVKTKKDIWKNIDGEEVVKVVDDESTIDEVNND